MQTKLNSPLTFLSPRRLNCRKPSPRFTHPKGGSTMCFRCCGLSVNSSIRTGPPFATPCQRLSPMLQSRGIVPRTVSTTMNTSRFSRRDFLRSTTAMGVAALGAPRLTSARPDTTLRVLSIGVIGTIGGTDRERVNAHPRAEIVGLCDVDANVLARAAEDHPGAFTCADYREAFDKHGDTFDAVIVATPDHSHCSIMTLALARGKHVYGQKPLVQQLEEVETLGQAISARPDLATQTGAQRIQSKPRRAAYDLISPTCCSTRSRNFRAPRRCARARRPAT